jgi:hypothetical protein
LGQVERRPPPAPGTEVFVQLPERHSRPEVAVVTTAGRSHSDDIRLRQRRYLMTQSVRMVCVVLAVALPVPVVWKAAFIAGAVALPWFGVVMANAGPTARSKAERNQLITREVAQPVRIAIEPGRVIDAD